MKLIIQIPSLNEAETLHRVISDLPTTLPGIETIETLVIDDGSSDGTAAVALGLGVDHVVRHRRNRGLAAAFRTGLRTCIDLDADIVVNTDGDHQYPGRFIADLIAPIVNGRADLVIGNRCPERDLRGRWIKRRLYRMGRAVIEGLTGASIPDATSGFRAMTAELANRTVVVTRYSYTLETLVGAVESEAAIEWIQIKTNAATRPSRLLSSLPEFVFRSGLTLLRVVFMHHPASALLKLALFVAALGSLPMIRLVIATLAGDGSGHVQSLVIGSALMVISAILAVGGMLADLIALRFTSAESIRTSERTGSIRLPPNASNGHDSDHVSTVSAPLPQLLDQ